jgi:hypothetical protein
LAAEFSIMPDQTPHPEQVAVHGLPEQQRARNMKFAFSKIYLYIAIAVLLLIIGLSVFFYFKGKKKGSEKTSIQYLPNDLPYGDPGNGGAAAGSSNVEIKSIANDMYDDMDGWNVITGHDMEPYKRAAILSDTDFVKLYNTFNSLYQLDSGQTMKEWLVNEKFWNNDITDALIDRCTKLNLK